MASPIGVPPPVFIARMASSAVSGFGVPRGMTSRAAGAPARALNSCTPTSTGVSGCAVA